MQDLPYVMLWTLYAIACCALLYLLYVTTRYTWDHTVRLQETVDRKVSEFAVAMGAHAKMVAELETADDEQSAWHEANSEVYSKLSTIIAAPESLSTKLDAYLQDVTRNLATTVGLAELNEKDLGILTLTDRASVLLSYVQSWLQIQDGIE